MVYCQKYNRTILFTGPTQIACKQASRYPPGNYITDEVKEIIAQYETRKAVYRDEDRKHKEKSEKDAGFNWEPRTANKRKKIE